MSALPTPDPTQCYFGILAEHRCMKPVKWVSTFKGERTQIAWCEDHKPNLNQILIRRQQGLEPIE